MYCMYIELSNIIRVQHQWAAAAAQRLSHSCGDCQQSPCVRIRHRFFFFNSWWQCTNWFIPFSLKYIVLSSLVCRSCVLHPRDVRRFELPHSKIERKSQEKWEPWVDGLGKLLVNTGKHLHHFVSPPAAFTANPCSSDFLQVSCCQHALRCSFQPSLKVVLAANCKQHLFVCGSFFSADANKHTWKAHPCLNIYFSRQIFLQTRSQHIRGQTVFWGMCQDFILWGCT